MSSKKQNDSIGSLFIQICKARRNKSNALLSIHDIHDGQDILLYYLHTENGQTVSSLVEKMCIQHATIATMIDRMVAKGLIEKVKDENDMRVSRVYLTKKGEEAIKQVINVWRKLELQTTNGLTDTEKKTLKTLLQKVMMNLQ